MTQPTIKSIKERGIIRNIFGSINNIAASGYIASDSVLTTTHGLQSAAIKAADEMKKMKFD